MARRTSTPEASIVASFRQRLYYAAPNCSVVGVPNAAKRSMWAAQQAKREGMATGFPDVLVLGPGRLIAAIEFKTAAGRLSDNQAEWLDRLERWGFPATVARSADEAMAFLRENGFPIREVRDAA